MTITYPNGTVLEAIMLSHEENEIRAIAAGCGDVLAFTRIHGTWISEKDSCRLMPSAQSELTSRSPALQPNPAAPPAAVRIGAVARDSPNGVRLGI